MKPRGFYKFCQQRSKRVPEHSENPAGRGENERLLRINKAKKQLSEFEMGYLGFLNLVLRCFDLLAWPLFALGYPLCASIRAIETNSNYHTRKLVTYWILFSLISLFELAFVKLLEWVPLWPYIKLGTICWLVLPRFKGAHYCYKSFVSPCLSVNLEEVMNRLSNRQEAPLEQDNFLSVAERYVSENGTEALEKLIASKGSQTDIGVEEIKAVAEAEKKEMPPTVKSYFNELNIDQKDINRMELPNGNALVAANWVKPVETILAHAEKKTVAAVEVKEVRLPPFPPATAEKVVSEKVLSEEVQKEWTCAVCQVTTSCEANLNSHLVGRKHIAKCEELKAIKQTAKNKASSSSPANKAAEASQDSKKYVTGDRLNQGKIKTKKQKVTVNSEPGTQNINNNTNSGSKDLKYWCPYCAVMCTSENDYMSHLKGKKHLAKVQERVQEWAGHSAGVQGWDYSGLPSGYTAGVQGWDYSGLPSYGS